MSCEPLTISIALCTYNGAPYVRAQLDSIARQSRLPMELIVADDHSTDGTVGIVRDFAATAPFPVHILENKENLGIARNFGQAIARCTGDIIALSDQDDLWREDKLGVVAAAFESDTDLTLLFTDADLVDQDLAPLGKRLSDTGHIDQSARGVIAGSGAFEFLLRKNVATGATMAFRRRLADLILPVPEKLLTYHDAWIVTLAAATGKVTFLAEPLIEYRQHAGQHTWDFVYVHGAKRVLDRAYYAAHQVQLLELRSRLSTAGRLPATSPAIAHLDGYIEHLRRRSTLPAARVARIVPVLSELTTGRYGRYSSGLRSAVRDLLAPPVDKPTAHRS